ncbi:hypothetical protein BOTBODRAFT_196358 [Botryobasidium botryosum FD-172 SS1]|uniref:Uncharacterized protein n=1 Tax=Botryobasidium botryosum (strain FD-172 SS1) TaxID=930990 RepID=A0A067NBT5_BOTB1|nr:hypothetical protein BOTBODRAFT_196358 [Botryobasidium botryosum FD-172 SS1]
MNPIPHQQSESAPLSQRLHDAVPTEIYSRIFLLAAQNAPDDYKQRESPVNVSHACRRWRMIALGYPALWTARITTAGHDPETLADLLARSGTRPLTVKVNRLRHGEGKEVLSVLGTAAERIKNLTIRNLPVVLSLMGDASSWLRATAWALEHLTVVKKHPRSVQYEEDLILASLFNETAPALRRIVVKGVQPCLHRTVYLGLQSLKLSRVILSSELVFDQLVDVFRNAERLEQVSLQDVYACFDLDTPPEPQQAASCALLTHLSIYTHRKLIVYLLSNLRIPSRCFLDIESYLERHNEALCSLLPPPSHLQTFAILLLSEASRYTSPKAMYV